MQKNVYHAKIIQSNAYHVTKVIIFQKMMKINKNAKNVQ